MHVQVSFRRESTSSPEEFPGMQREIGLSPDDAYKASEVLHAFRNTIEAGDIAVRYSSLDYKPTEIQDVHKRAGDILAKINNEGEDRPEVDREQITQEDRFLTATESDLLVTALRWAASRESPDDGGMNRVGIMGKALLSSIEKAETIADSAMDTLQDAHLKEVKRQPFIGRLLARLATNRTIELPQGVIEYAMPTADEPFGRVVVRPQ